jgi:hypothetical protein
MNAYVATFHSHYDALSYCRALKGRGVAAQLMPVPRELSASCGTSVSYTHGSAIEEVDGLEPEAVYLETEGALELVFRAP